jgi:DNA-binding transcriptional ArsR family regulator
MPHLPGGAKILLALRDKKTMTWRELCAALGIPLPRESIHYYLAHRLEGLREAGLIDYEGKYDPDDGTSIMVTDRWHQIQAALGVSLSQLASVERGRSLVIQPYFGTPAPLSTGPDLFVAMPFLPSLRPIFDDHILPVARRIGLSAVRADDFFATRSIVSDIWAAVCAARIVVADCTGRNPNVFYEIGLAHTVGRPVILITQTDDDVPFDLRHIRYIRYEYTPRGMSDFEQRLAATIREEWPEAAPADSLGEDVATDPAQ